MENRTPLSECQLLYFPLPERYEEYKFNLLAYYESEEEYIYWCGKDLNHTLVEEIELALYMDYPKLDIPEMDELYQSIRYFMYELGIRLEYIVGCFIERGNFEIYYDRTDTL